MQSRKQLKSGQSKSAVVDHAVQNNHFINWNDAKVLAIAGNPPGESTWNRKRAPNTKNIDEGPRFKSKVINLTHNIQGLTVSMRHPQISITFNEKGCDI